MAGGDLNRRTALGALSLAALGGTYLVSTAGNTQATELALSPPDARRLVREGKLVLVDIRRPDEWAATGVPQGALAIDMRRADFIEAVKETAGNNPDVPIAFICAGGVRSRWVTNALTDAGLTNLVDIPEGMLGSAAGPGWLARGLPVEAVAE